MAHEKRLACLKTVLEQPGLTVGEIARRLHVAKNQASLFLRALQARGLVGARRQSRWVYYAPDPDPLIPGSSRLLAALRRALVDEKRPASEIRFTLTGFTHPRRLAILHGLSEDRSVAFEDLAAATRISPPALSRHLVKLDARRLVRCCTDDGWRLCSAPDPLAQTLLGLIATNNVG